MTSETTARGNRYGVSGIPHVMIDGTMPFIGADLCPVMIEEYSGAVDSRLASSGGVSPVKITGDVQINGNVATITAYFELMDPGSFTAHQGTLYLYEDDITWCCGYGGEDHWDGVVRMVRSTPVTLTEVGQIVMVQQTVNVANFNQANLHPAAVFERVAGNKEIIQASDFTVPDYALAFPVRVASVPAGNGIAYYAGTVTNVSESADVVTLSVDAGFGWTTDFQIEGDPNYYQNHPLALAPGEEKDITVRVQTDGVKRIGIGNFSGVSQNSGRASHIALKLFNGSHSILLVDDDNNGDYQTDFTVPLTNLGYLYETVTGATIGIMRGFDAVIWQTAYQTSNTILAADQENLISYLDEGGKLYLSSAEFLGAVQLPNTFATDYLGVASFTVNTRSARAVGVGGDPITDNMDMALNWPSGPANRVDTVNPTEDASIIFNSDTGNPAAIKRATRSYRTVFNTICQDAFPTTGADPNNNETVIEKIMDWLLGGDPTSTPDGLPVVSRVLTTGPNPVRTSAEIGFALSASGAKDVRLSLVDASGRQVRSLLSGPMSAGNHRIVWDGKDNSGHLVSTGLYFARLETGEGTSSSKLVVIR